MRWPGSQSCSLWAQAQQHPLYRLPGFAMYCLVHLPHALEKKLRLINTDHSPLADSKTSQLNQEVQSSQEDQLDREGRFLLYWITTTSISTSTSFTTTVSISGKVVCTSTGITGLNVCGKWFWYPPPPSARPFTAPLVWIVQTEEWPLVDQPKQPMWHTICF